MKIKTSDLIGPALDWAVAVAAGATHFADYKYGVILQSEDKYDTPLSEYHPSTDWSQGGPIIECHDMWLGKMMTDGRRQMTAIIFLDHELCVEATGPTPLIAAMRCYVTSKLGDEVEVPDELIGG